MGAADERGAPGILVDVGGYRLHALVEGDHEPAVVLEAGTWDFSPTWALVQPKIAGFARTIAYDRAGLGWSDAGPLPRTADTMVTELRTLCSALDVQPGMVLVAQSFGGLIAKLYAHRHPDEVGGLVLVDPAHEDQLLRSPEALRAAAPAMKQMEAQMLEALRDAAARGDLSALPIPPGLPDRAVEAYRTAVSSARDPVGGMAAESDALEALQEELRRESIKSLGDLPLIVLSHSAPPPLPPFVEGGPTLAADYESSWQEMQAETAALSPAGRQILVEGSGHMIHHERPEVVVEAARDVLAAARAGPRAPNGGRAERSQDG